MSTAPGNRLAARAKAEAFIRLGDRISQDKSLEAAERCYRQATGLAPNLPSAWRKLADCQAELRRTEDQLVSLNEAVRCTNEDPEAIYRLGRRLEMSHRLADLDALARKYGRRFTNNPWILALEAVNFWRNGNLQQAKSIVDQCLALESPDGPRRFLYWLLGTLLDHSGDHGAAYRQFVRMNEFSAREIDANAANRFHERVARLQRYVQTVAPASCRARSEQGLAEDDRGPIFITGFPRSGTTLMGSLLNSQPDLVTRDEWGGINAVIRLMQSRSLNYPEFIGALGDATRQELLAHYRREMQIEGSSEKYVDKMPFNLVHLELILKLYPRARILVMIRHPYDVCFSCFSQSIRLNSAMQNFLSLERAAQTYDHVMSLAKHYLESARASIYPVRYEDLTANLQQTTESMFAFLGVRWSPQILRFHEHASRALDVRTPSYHQVVQPLYRRSVPRWQCYREFLQPCAEWLDPWCRYFKYSLPAESIPDRNAAR